MTDSNERQPQTTEEIPWNMWVKSRCTRCNRSGETRYRLIVKHHLCPACGQTLVQVGQPFPIVGSDGIGGPFNTVSSKSEPL